MFVSVVPKEYYKKKYKIKSLNKTLQIKREFLIFTNCLVEVIENLSRDDEKIKKLDCEWWYKIKN